MYKIMQEFLTAHITMCPKLYASDIAETVINWENRRFDWENNIMDRINAEL